MTNKPRRISTPVTYGLFLLTYITGLFTGQAFGLSGIMLVFVALVASLLIMATVKRVAED